MGVIATVVVVPLVLVMTVLAIMAIQKYRKTRANDAECDRLLEQAQATLRKAGHSHSVHESQLEHIYSAFNNKDALLLSVYVRLLDQQSAGMIRLTVLMVEYMRDEKNTNDVEAETLTGEQVSVYREVRKHVPVSKAAEHAMDNAANRIGYWAMSHVDDYPLIVSIVQRGVTDLDEIKTILAEMKASKATSLSDGML